jgi:hypothetical protein
VTEPIWQCHIAMSLDGTPELPLRMVKCVPKSRGALHIVYEKAE